mgnify:CR=1 FL=1
MQQEFKYFAFISYSSQDTEWGRRVQRKLESYRMPATLCSEHGWRRRPINPVFFAPTDIQPGGLTAELQERLRASRHLIVICSPRSARSEWVGREIAYFHELGRTGQIHFFIVDGTPHSGNPDTECFNPIVETLGLPEILGANIREPVYRWAWLNRERAYVQLVTKLLGVEFDTIWQRHKRLLAQKIVALILTLLAVAAALAGVWQFNQPVDAELRLRETSVHNPHLPPLENAIVTVTLDNETRRDTIRSLADSMPLPNIPRRLMRRQARVQVECRAFQPVDTVVRLTEQLRIDIRRQEDYYGLVSFRLHNPATGNTAPYTDVIIDGHHARSDEEGRVRLVIPLAGQKTAYPVSSPSLQLLDSVLRPPFGPDDILQFR